MCVLQELLLNKDDYYLRVLRPLWREICRSLRYEVDFHKFCSGLFQDRKVCLCQTIGTSICVLIAQL